MTDKLHSILLYPQRVRETRLWKSLGHDFRKEQPTQRTEPRHMRSCFENVLEVTTTCNEQSEHLFQN